MGNFSTHEIGPWSDMEQHVFQKGPLKRAGKVFLGEKIQATGSEVSVNRIEAGDGYGFTHRHREHEEIYVVVAGAGDFLVDGTIIPVQAGSVLRIAPEAERTVRASAERPLDYVCIQAVAGSLNSRDVSDGELVNHSVNWPD